MPKQKSTSENVKTKCKRIGVVLGEEQHEKLTQICYMKRTTITAVVQSLVDEFIRQNRGDLTRFKKIFGKDSATIPADENSFADTQQPEISDDLADTQQATAEPPPVTVGDDFEQ